ncbi:unnamed protein product [Dibothriocephalus latus]|uniref:Uncharacterized protein n=1 Tax=Dibothriocephalus latus TaxID=60516 RepID=A0A3P6T793_DIBLA|nr:unnamed protein product [Dibothriocephalus latus]
MLRLIFHALLRTCYSERIHRFRGYLLTKSTVNLARRDTPCVSIGALLADKYIISSLFFLTLICIWHGGIAVIEKVAMRFDIPLWSDMELYVILLIGIGYFAFNVGFILMIYCVACKRRRDMKSKDSEYLVSTLNGFT